MPWRRPCASWPRAADSGEAAGTLKKDAVGTVDDAEVEAMHDEAAGPANVGRPGFGGALDYRDSVLEFLPERLLGG